ncbi:exocyst complex component exo84 [Rhodotorula kratochvilovae]
MAPPPSAPSSSSRPPKSSSGPSPAASASFAGGSRGGVGARQVRVAEDAPPSRPRAQSNVGARLLKKRQSVAYHAHPGVRIDEAGVPDVPRLPPLPQGVGGARPPGGGGAGGDAQFVPSGVGLAPVAGGSSGQQQPRAPSPQQQLEQHAPPPQSPRPEAEGQLLATGLDIEQLASEGFKPEDFLKQSLPTGRADHPAQMEDLRRLKGRLEGAMRITEGELQKSVFNNYADFVLISKEIATLENEMLELKGVLEEWRAVPESLEGGWGDDDLLMGGAGGPNRRTQRNSIADLATLYKSQLSALWEGVEGSQKFLPYVPGRHIITEASTFVELHAATYKPKQQVHLFLLNDAMLVSVKKRRGPGIGGPVRLVAERCFNLSDIVVVDLKDAGDLQNAVKIKRGKETIIYRTDKPEDKKMLLLAFKKVAEELMNKRRKEMLSEAEARKGDPRGFRSDFDGTFASSGFSPAAILGVGRDDPTGRDQSWIGDFSDELSVSIATREFEDAVVWVEKGKSILPQIAGDAHASQLFRAKLDQRTVELVSALLHDLSDHAIRKSGVVRTTSWLLRLGQGERARETFLTARGRLVRKRARQIKFEGDISMYISELAMVCFTLIKNTCEWYMAAFKDNRMASGFVRWASEQVEIYAEMFRRQVYGADQDGKVIEESLEVTKAHGAMLRDVGLDFTFLLDGLLRPQKPSPKARVSSSRLRDEGLTGGHLRPQKQGAPQSAVALARQSIFMLHGGAGSDGASRPATPGGGGLAVPRAREREGGEEARGRPASGAGFQQDAVGEAK